MATKKIFSIDGSSISQMISNLFSGISQSKFVATSQSGQNIVNLPLLFAIIIALVFPVVILIGVILSVVFKINVSIVKESTNSPTLIDKQ